MCRVLCYIRADGARKVAKLRESESAGRAVELEIVTCGPTQ